MAFMSLEKCGNCRLDLSRQNHYEFSFASVIGTRSSQEDYLGIFTSSGSIAACICDGMGGLECGSAASEMSVGIFADEMAASIDGFARRDPDAFLSLLNKMDHDVHRLRKPDGSRANAGSTIAAAFVCDGVMNWLSVGDSTVYYFHAGEITRLNQYQNYQEKLDRKLEQGLIDRERYIAESRRGHALTAFIGMGGIREFDAGKQPVELARNDCVLLCSDGVTNRLTPSETAEVISGKSAWRAMADLMALLGEKSRGKSSDNATAVLIRIK